MNYHSIAARALLALAVLFSGGHLSTPPIRVADLASVGTVGGRTVAVTDLSGTPITQLATGIPNFSGGQGGIPMLVGDQLLVNAFTNIEAGQITVVIRAVDANGNANSSTQTFPIPGGYTLTSFLMPLPAGFLQCVTLYGLTQPPGPRWTYATAGIVNPASGMNTPYLTLIADYITSTGTSAFQGRGPIGPLEGPGLKYTQLIYPIDPGQGWDTGPPNMVQWEVHWISAVLVTSSAAGDRQLICQPAISTTLGDTNTQFVVPQTVGPSTQIIANFGVGGTSWQNGAPFPNCPLPRPFVLNGGDGIGSSNATLDAADQYDYALIGITEKFNPDGYLNFE